VALTPLRVGSDSFQTDWHLCCFAYPPVRTHVQERAELSMKISVIGAGDMGGALAQAFSAHHRVTVTGSKPGSESAAALVRSSKGKISELPIDKARKSDLVVLAVPWDNVDAALKRLGSLQGVTLLVVTLPWIDGDRLALGFDTSGAESIAARARGARVIQAFNTMSATTIRQARRYRPKATVFVAGAKGPAKRKIERLAREIGFDAVDAGGLESARYTEPLAMLWAAMVVRGDYRDDLAFRALHATK
jgi:8-hydroxy-5-deazaflavin:NADPH oxidoreductase